MLLGEARSKCEHLAKAPLKPALADQLHQIFLAKGIHATTAIEGNTLSELEVKQVIGGDLQLPKSRQYLGDEVKNVLRAIDSIYEDTMRNGNWQISTGEICNLNRFVLEGLDVEDHVVPGEIRQCDLRVGRYKAPPWSECESLLNRMCDWLNSDDFKQTGEQRLPFGILRAIVAHVYLAWIHAFGDGNGRTARAIEFKILVASGVPSPAAHLLSNHYNATRAEYYRQLEYASESGGDLSRFVLYAIQGFVDGLRSQLAPVWDQLYEIVWRDFVHEQFRGQDGPNGIRLRKLVLAMSELDEPASGPELLRISPHIAALYQGMSRQTMHRDLNDVVDMKLVQKLPGGFKANREIIRGFAPGHLDEGNLS